jgi:hypothetical protein
MSYDSHKYYNGNLYAGIAMDVKKPTTIMKPLCEYCIFEMALWKL